MREFTLFRVSLLPEFTVFYQKKPKWVWGQTWDILAAVLIEQGKEALKEGGDGEAEIVEATEIQSVTTAISILRQHVTQPNVKLSDWNRLQGK